MRISKSMYLDTNGFIYAYFYSNRPQQAENLLHLQYYQEGNYVLRVLDVCREKSIRVFSTDLAFLEMSHNYCEWERLRQFLDAGAPLGLIFGKNQRMDSEFLKKPLSREDQQRLIANSEQWLNTWDYRDLIEFEIPGEIPNWLNIAKYLYSYINETVLDCLHLAAAISLECDFFLTKDEYLRKTISQMRQDTKFKREIKQKFDLSRGYGLPNAVQAKTFNGD